MGVPIRVIYQGDLHCEAVHGPSGSVLHTDAPLDNGGRGERFSPTDLVATALGSCVLTILGLLARQHGWPLEGTRIDLVKEMVTDPVRRIGRVTADVHFPAGLRFSAKDRLIIRRAAETCPVKHSLHPDVTVDLRFHFPDSSEPERNDR
ncbi:MAG: putative stress-induced protein OsmC [Candidatus Ozemobacter sibiricus]|uniref:Putative stress-induced protein OsmC n=1 Tax=Candidatus Ozemobacter sibiricus TaxID=2268124 RepID=A0A367ZLS4_9BACT|nr:MAG: putative stress-induced protein OsmC [Candidatus Ozemobacter sibiricus]